MVPDPGRQSSNVYNRLPFFFPLVLVFLTLLFPSPAMRLLNTVTKELFEFQSDVPAYAILSHVWEKEEVTFRDIGDLDKAKKMQGFSKIIGACDTAIKDGLKYIWIDTCCINKDSSAEVSEAINSMYMWYKNSRVCYAYLSDVSKEDDHENSCSFFATSLWFSRGWTLQELIAPRRVVFYGMNWIDIGTKATLRHTISTITGIDIGVITDGSLDRLNSIPVAVRMSWAADRNTTREEDVAYSLMGLFGVTMPLLYGERGKAFIRLQHEIIKQSDDHSIFAWASQDDGERGILARSPSEFRNSEKVERIPDSSEDSKPYFITNKGLRIDLPTLSSYF
ncbi:heterokaryon incompatibility protein-domain-containing protein [Collybia nuda]|uniref:Heterokaryon incompatibility protein-domain-containing protein n=1 Tax=Collybia nuda TaxID=64659 RepID=A0A9P6CBP0_9AGAR|nr:heterokaryon incompatibility protein-domain-containing protein [Collybia nuda]